MTPIPGTTKAQTIFLRAFRTSPTGPAPENWPSPSVLRRWLRRPGFRIALESVRQALRFQADFQLSASATHAIKSLSAQALTVLDVNRLLRTSHVRQRFAPTQTTTDADPSHNHKTEEDKDEEGVEKCPLCRRRAADPYWIGNKEIFKQAAFREGYTSPLREWPDFPEPVPQDTFYYKLIKSPDVLLQYMLQYDKAFNDHRFQPILLSCKILLHISDDPALPRFAVQRAQSNLSP